MDVEQRLLLRGIETIETPQRLDVPPDLRTRFRGRAQRRADRLNAKRVFPSYRYEVVREGGRFLVVAMQNVARKKA
jgi:hypothetical protein